MADAVRTTSDSPVSALQWCALGGVLIGALIPASAAVELFPYWDLDPTSQWVPPTGIGPTMMLGLVVLALLSGGLAMVAEARRCGSVSIAQVVLAGLGSVGVIAHTVLDGPLHDGAVDGIEHAVKAAPWLALVWGAVGMSHLCRDRRVRTVAIAILAGFTVPLMTKGVLQVYVDHPATVAEFESTRQAVFESNGWRPDSPAALAYERRLMQAEASGWFGLSNVYASFMGAIGAGLIAACAAAIGAQRRITQTTWIAMGVAACTIAGLLLSKSKGGIGAMGLSLALCAGFAVVRRWKPGMGSRLGGFVGPAAVVLVLAAIGVRGLIGTDLGEKSLLFRAFYAVGSLRIWGEHPIFGIGPDGFQDAYAAAKIPIATETVQSPHSVIFDWTSTLGVFGLAWVAWLVWRSTRLFDGLGDSKDADEALIPISRDMVRGAVLVVASIGLVSAFIERELATPAYAIARVAGLAGWIGASVGLMRLVRTNAGGWLMAGAGVALVAHAQIEVTPVWVNAAPLFGVWFGMATVGRVPKRVNDADPVSESARRGVLPRFGFIAKPVLPITLAAWVAASVWAPVWRWESNLKAAALVVRPGAELRSAFDEAVAGRDRAGLQGVAGDVSAMAGSAVPARPETLDRAISGLELALVEAALEPLGEASGFRPAHMHTHQARGRLLLRLGASHPDLDVAKGSIIFAVDEAKALPSYRPRSTGAWDWYGVASAQGYDLWQARTGEPAEASGALHPGDAIVAWMMLAQRRTPHAVRPAVRLMELWARAGLPEEARVWAAEALRRDGLTGLDPISGLTDAERARAEALLAK